MYNDLVSHRELHADLCVVGAGIIGVAHALEARRRGLSVVLLEREDRAVGASVRNFGHLFAGSQPDGPALELALAARERWLELDAAAGLGVVQAGTLIVARAPDELAVLETAVAEPARGARMLTAAETLELAPLPAAGIIGGLHCRLDLRVDPRVAVARLTALLEADPEVTVAWGTHVHAVEPGVVHAASRAPRTVAAPPAATSLTVRAEAIIVAPGPDYAALPPELQSGLEGLTRCRLQMLRVAAPGGRRYGPALATGLSLIRYPAFAEQAPTAVLRERLTRERPELVQRGIHLLVTQRPDGDLIIGDSHSYGDTLEPFADERIDALLLAEAAQLLGADGFEVRERWLGLYATRATATASTPAPYAPFHVTAPLPGVRVVENVAGIGMTLSLGFAPRVLDGLGDRAAQPAAALGG